MLRRRRRRWGWGLKRRGLRLRCGLWSISDGEKVVRITVLTNSSIRGPTRTKLLELEIYAACSRRRGKQASLE